MMPDYLIVGPTLELRTPPRQQMPQASGPLVGAFRVTRRAAPLGQAVAQLAPAGVQMIVRADSALSDDEIAEAYKLLARISSRQTDQSRALFLPAPGERKVLSGILSADGFAPADNAWWRRPPGSFTLGDSAKFDDNTDVYRDPYCIPWNFVAREWDVTARMVADSRRPSSIARGGPMRVLDLGCGYGKNATALEELGFAVWGVDFSAAAIERCRQLVKSPDNYVTGSATSLPWPDRSFDYVIDVGCLHCLASNAERSTAIREAARVLAPGGALYSRSFKPRSAQWLCSQPFRTSSFGLTAEQILGLMRPHFHASIWLEHDDHNYALAKLNS